MLPVRLRADASVNALLRWEPTPELHGSLSALGFWRSGYPDERLGNIRRLDEVLRLAEDAGNPIWKMTAVRDSASVDVVGNILDHVRVYIPDATGVRLPSASAAVSGAAVRKLGADWVSWAEFPVRVTH